MKKQIEKLRTAMESAQADEMREAKENDSMVFVPRAEIIKSYFEGYEQALKDMEDNDPAYGVDLMEEIKKALLKINKHIESVNESIDAVEGKPNSEESFAYVLGQDRALQIARSILSSITNKVSEAQVQTLLERNAHES